MKYDYTSPPLPLPAPDTASAAGPIPKLTPVSLPVSLPVSFVTSASTAAFVPASGSVPGSAPPTAAIPAFSVVPAIEDIPNSELVALKAFGGGSTSPVGIYLTKSQPERRNDSVYVRQEGYLPSVYNSCFVLCLVCVIL